jgi:hypothetical protein
LWILTTLQHPQDECSLRSLLIGRQHPGLERNEELAAITESIGTPDTTAFTDIPCGMANYPVRETDTVRAEITKT